jgi:hypothetical protein
MTSRSVQCYFAVLTIATLLRHVISTGNTRTDDVDGLFEESKLDLWSRGLFDLDYDLHNNGMIGSLVRSGPVSYVRRELLTHRNSQNCDMNGYCRFRGGSQDSSGDYEKHAAQKIDELGARFGSEFLEAIEKNKIEHAEDCEKSCEIYFCSDPSNPLVPFDTLMGETTIKSYSMGSVPPEDFAESFG